MFDPGGVLSDWRRLIAETPPAEHHPFPTFVAISSRGQASVT
jgi:hypothetical protein